MGDKMFYINPLTIILFIFFIIIGKINSFFICYICMTVHELAHLAAALFIGLLPKKFSFQPYGVNLTLKNKIIYSFSDEVILYLAGPFANIVLAFFGMLIFGRTKTADYFYICNILLFFMNILPVKPLDGGVLLEKTLLRFYAPRSCRYITFGFSLIFSCLFLIFGIYCIGKTHFNASVIIISGLLFVNLFNHEEKYSVNLLQEFLFQKEKRKIPIHNKTKIIVANEDEALSKVAENFKFKNYSLVFFKKGKKISSIMTESEIIDKILSD